MPLAGPYGARQAYPIPLQVQSGPCYPKAPPRAPKPHKRGIDMNTIAFVAAVSLAIALTGWIVGAYFAWLVSLAIGPDGWNLIQVTGPAGVLAVMVALAAAAPGDFNGNPERLAAATHALTIGGMYASAERQAVACPRGPGCGWSHMPEDEACRRAEEWTGEGLDALVELDR